MSPDKMNVTFCLMMKSVYLLSTLDNKPSFIAEVEFLWVSSHIRHLESETENVH